LRQICCGGVLEELVPRRYCRAELLDALGMQPKRSLALG
jgi:hypothetical protein